MNSKPILFIDFDGTLCFDKYWRSLPEEQYNIIQSFIFGGDKTLLNDWMRGKYTAEEINKLVAEKINMPFEELWGLFVKDCRTMHVSPEVLEKISSFRNKYTVILITGNMDSFTRFTVPALQLDNFFDYTNNSFHEGKLKTDDSGIVFSNYAKHLNTLLKESVLIDDSVKACESFRNLDGIAYLITSEFDINYYLKNL